MNYTGRPVKRKEDPKLITGRGRFVDDLAFPGMVHMSILRSHVAHAKVKKVDVSSVRGAAGVADVITGLTLNVPDRAKNFPMAHDEVLYVGHPVAVLLTKDRYRGEDLLEEVSFDYDVLPAVVDPDEALEDRVKALEGRSNIGYKNTYRSGDAEAALGRARIVLEERLEMARVYPAPMETRGLVCVPEPGRLTVYASTQSAHYMRKYLIDALSPHVKDIRVVQTDVGGAFGAKLIPYAEEYLAAHAAVRTGRPVKWVAQRREDMLGMYHGRGMYFEGKFGAHADGTLAGIHGKIVLDLGAARHGFYLADIASTLITGLYRLADVYIDAYGVYTNKTPIEQYRGAGRPEAAFFIERMVDHLADELGLDPVEMRRRNLIRKLPYTNPFGLKYDSGDYESLLNRAELHYREFERRAAELTSNGIKAGVGLSFYVEQNNFGPWESASVRVKWDGSVIVVVGSGPSGQGTVTSIAQLVADELQIDIERVEVAFGDTDVVAEGFGSYGSRTMTLAGNAAIIAARRVKEKALRLAAEFMDSSVEELRYADGRIMNSRTGETLTLKELASMNMGVMGGVWSYRNEPGLEASAYFGLDNFTFPYGSHVALVTLGDGRVRVLDYVALDDIGTVVNPMLAEGQVVGGVHQGYGEAVMEAVVYDHAGSPVTLGFGEYALPTALEAFNARWYYQEAGSLTPNEKQPLVSKGIAEGATIGAPAALARAIEKAAGKKVLRLPVGHELLG